MKPDLAEAVARHLPQIVDLRRFLHQIPEASMAEKKTSAALLGVLHELGLTVRENLAGTGLLATLESGRPGPFVMLRADMDALPIEERTQVPYRSRHQGYGHACGHDGHCAAVVGAARVLADLREELTGSVGFLFQPGEEVSRGARKMLAGGLFSHQLPDAIFTLHGWPHLPVGTVACKRGTIMAATDTFTLTVHGEGGHGARPAMAKNPLRGVARVAERFMDMTTDQRVVSPCVARVGHKDNVIDETGTLVGTTRNLTADSRARTMAEMREVATSTCQELGMTAELSFVPGCPPVVIRDALYDRFVEVGGQLLGPEHVVELQTPSMESEDFGCYLEHVPGLLFRLGLGEPSPELHNPCFDFNDEVLATGVTVLVGLVLDRCQAGA